MQRSTSANASPSTPPSNGPPSKRIRLSNGNASPATPSTPSSMHDAVQAALAAEEQQRLRALDKHMAGSGETRWALSVQVMPQPDNALNFVTAGFGDIDRLDGDELEADNTSNDGVESAPKGRRRFGRAPIP